MLTPFPGAESNSIIETITTLNDIYNFDGDFYVMHGGIRFDPDPDKSEYKNQPIIRVYLITDPEQIEADNEYKVKFEDGTKMIFPVSNYYVNYDRRGELNIFPLEEEPVFMSQTHKYNEYAQIRNKALIQQKPMPYPLEL